MNNGVKTGFGSSRPAPVPGRLVLLPRFDGRNLPARAAWLGKVNTQSSDLLIQKSMPSAAIWSAAGFASTTGRVVAISASGSSAYSDDDGLTWAAGGALPTGTGWNFIAFGAGLFVAINNDAANNACATSPDGVTWTSRTLAAGAYVSIVFGGGKFVVAIGSGAVKTSSDGITWGTGGSPGTANLGITYLSSAGLYVVTGSSGPSYPQTSPDGTTWTNRAANINGAAASLVTASPTRVMTLLATAAGNWLSIQSSDGINWVTQGVPPPSTNGSSALLTYGNGMFFMAGNAGLLCSLDGTNWRPPTSFSSGSVNSALNPTTATLINGMVTGKSRVILLPSNASQQSVYLTDNTAQDLYYVP